MPAANVTVSATFENAGTTEPSTSPDPDADKVTVKLDTNSSADADVKVGTTAVTKEGISVAKTGLSITVTPKTDKKLTGVTVTGGTVGTQFAAATHENSYTTAVTVTGNEVTVKVGTADKTTTPTKTKIEEDFTVTVTPASPTVGQQLKAELTKKADKQSAVAPTDVSWKWQEKAATGETYTDVQDATSATFTPNKAGTYKAVATVGTDVTYEGTVTSEAVTVEAKVTRNAEPSGDTQVQYWADNSTTGVNYGTDTTMQVGGSMGTNNYRAISLVKFTKPADINKEVTKATLRLNLAVIDKNDTTQSRDASVEIYSTGESDWDETKLVYNSSEAGKDSVFVSNARDAAYIGADSAIGALSANKLGETVNPKGKNVGDWIEFDVTDYVKAYGGDYSFAILSVSGTGAYAFNTKEATTEANRPQLVIEYGDDDSTVTAPKAKHTVTVTSPTGGTLTTDRTKNLREGDTVTITAKATDAGHKAVPTATGESALDLTPGDNDTWTFEMPDHDVTVAATYPRDDIDTVTIEDNAGGQPKTLLAKSETATYKAVLKKGEQAITLDPDGNPNDKVTWTAVAKSGSAALATNTKISATGELTIDTTQADTVIEVTASVPAKFGEDTPVTKTIEVTVTSAQRYSVEVDSEFESATAHGQLEVLTPSVVANEAVYVKVTPDTGYNVGNVTYKDTETGTTYQGNLTEVVEENEHKGQYTFTMAADTTAKNVKISATFEQENYTITNGTPEADKNDNHGHIAVAATAHYGDTVTVTVTPLDATYAVTEVVVEPTTPESETEIEVEGSGTEWTFSMPAEPVTVTATFDIKPIERSLPPYNTLVKSLDTTEKVGNRTVKKLTATETIQFDELINATQTTSLINDMDIYIPDGLEFKVTMQHSSKHQGSVDGMHSTLVLTGASGKIQGKGQDSNSSFNGLKESGTTKNGDLDENITSGTWLRMTLTAVPKGTTYEPQVNFYKLDEQGQVDGDAIKTYTLTMRNGNNASKIDKIVLEVGGTAAVEGQTIMLDNVMIYSPTKKSATINVKHSEDGTDGSATAAEDATVKILRGTDELITVPHSSEGNYTIDLEPGEYTAKVVDDDNYETKDGTLTVDKDSGGSVNIIVKDQPQVAASIKIFGGLAGNAEATPHTVFKAGTDRTDFMTLTATVYNANGKRLKDQSGVTWTSDKTGDITVGETDGKLTIKSGATEGDKVKITATKSEGITDDYYLQINHDTAQATDQEEVILAATDDFEGTTSIFNITTGAIDSFLSGHVLKYGAKGQNDGADVATATFASPLEATGGKNLVITFDAYTGKMTNYTDPHVKVSFQNAAGEDVFSYTYDTNTTKVENVSLLGKEQISGDKQPFDFWTNNQNEWSKYGSAGNTKVALTISETGATVDFTKASAKTTFTEAEGTITDKKISKIVVHHNVTPDTRSGGMDNLVTKLVLPKTAD